jgi:hypothetical protein
MHRGEMILIPSLIKIHIPERMAETGLSVSMLLWFQKFRMKAPSLDATQFENTHQTSPGTRP